MRFFEYRQRLFQYRGCIVPTYWFQTGSFISIGGHISCKPDFWAASGPFFGAFSNGNIRATLGHVDKYQ